MDELFEKDFAKGWNLMQLFCDENNLRSISDTAKEIPQEGTIVAVGPGRLTDEGNRIPMDVAVGDTVVYSKYAGTEYKEGDIEYLVLRDDDILFKK